MRVSLLLQREPFGPILERTLATFFQAQTHHPYQVQWYDDWPNIKSVRQRGEQHWLCNIYLNAIFTPEADATIFDPILREFSRSLVYWRKPLQSAYAKLAIRHPTASWLAQASLGITPSIVNAEHLLIVAGNHKIRVLDSVNREVYGILKSGFVADFIEREITTRQLVAKLELPVPALKTVDASHTWFSEQYISATPVNRLPDKRHARQMVQAAMISLQRLYGHTMQEEFLDEYADKQAEQAHVLIGNNQLMSPRQKILLLETVDSLCSQINRLRPVSGNRIITTLSHGDFHPANILANVDGVWLIDWEYSARRQIAYDRLVFELQSRFIDNLGARLLKFAKRGERESDVLLADLIPNKDTHQIYAPLFLLEELVLHLEENANPLFSKLGKGLLGLQQQIDIWTVATQGVL